ncbi:MAG: transglutaminase domain-containing protein [Polyangiales bacterium]
MTTPSRDDRFERALLALLLVDVIASFAVAFDAQAAWVLTVPAFLALFVKSDVAGPVFVDRALLVQRLSFGLALVFAWFGMLRALPPEGTQRGLTVLAGYHESMLALVFLLRARSFSLGRSFFPAAGSVLVLAGLNRHDAQPWFVAIAAGLVAIYTLVSARALDGREPERRRPHRAELAMGLLALLGTLGFALATNRFLPWAHREIERRIWDYRLTPPDATTGLTDGDTRLGQIEELAQSHDVALRVWSDRPERLRARVYTQFIGRGWRASPLSARAMIEQPTSSPLESSYAGLRDDDFGATFASPDVSLSDVNAAETKLTRIVVSDLDAKVLPSPGELLLVRGPGGALRLSESGTLVPPEDVRVDRYAIVHRRRSDVGQRRASDVDTLQDATSVPRNTHPKVRALAEMLSRQAATPQGRVDATIDFLKANYHYTLAPGVFHTDQPIAEFLLEKKRGYCEYFATAAALLLRLQGVPTRYVTGFMVTEDSRVGDHFVVRDEDAHAWIEAWIDGRGWIVADAVPSAELEGMHRARRTPWNARWEALRAWTSDVSSRLRAGGLIEALRLLYRATRVALIWAISTAVGRVVALLVAALLFAWRLRHFLRARAFARRAEPLRAHVPLRLRRTLDALEEQWRRLGVARPASRGLDEHLRTLARARDLDDVTRWSAQIVAPYYRASFGHEAIDEATQREADAALKALRRRPQ